MIRTPVRAEKAVAVGLAAVALLVLAWLALKPEDWGDWQSEALPAANALVAGHVVHFLQLAPAYGGSLILRAPFMLATKLWHGHENSVYRASVAPCLLAAGVLGVWLASRMRAAGSPRVAC